MVDFQNNMKLRFQKFSFSKYHCPKVRPQNNASILRLYFQQVNSINLNRNITLPMQIPESPSLLSQNEMKIRFFNKY